MEPYPVNTMLTALSHDLGRDIWRGRDHDAIQLSGYILDVAVG